MGSLTLHTPSLISGAACLLFCACSSDKANLGSNHRLDSNAASAGGAGFAGQYDGDSAARAGGGSSSINLPGHGGGTAGYAGNASGTQTAGGPNDVVGGSAGPCDANPCLNGGSCVPFLDAFTCVCPDSYTGDLCRYSKFHGIRALPGHISSSVSEISSDGAIVIGSSWDGHPFITDSPTRSAVRFVVSDSTLEELNPVGVSDCSGAFTNLDGSSLIGNCGRLVRWTEGRIDWLDPNLSDLYVLKASRDALVLVGSTVERQAFRWSEAGVELLPCVGECCASADAVASNLDGSLLAIQCGLHAPYQWTPAGGLMPLELDDPGAVSIVKDVSANGRVIVGYVDSRSEQPSTGVERAVAWRDGRLTTLGPGMAYGCNNDGSIVWGYDRLWDANGSHALMTLIGATPDLAGWSDLSVLDASDDGKILVGNGIHDGHSEGWVARVDLLGMPPITK